MQPLFLFFDKRFNFEYVFILLVRNIVVCYNHKLMKMRIDKDIEMSYWICKGCNSTQTRRVWSSDTKFVIRCLSCFYESSFKVVPERMEKDNETGA